MTRSWTLGTCLALVMHAGSAAAILVALPSWQAPQDEDYGALLIDLAALPVSQESEATEAPGAEDMQERLATRDLTETLSAKREIDLPTEQAAPEKPEDTSLQFAQEHTRKEQDKPTEEQVTEAMQKQEAQQASQRAAEGAETTEAGDKPEDSKAAEFGSRAEAERRALEAWQKALMTQLARHRRYPDKARAAKQEGEALVRFSLNRQGLLTDQTLVHTAGSPLLDGEAIDMLRRAGPLPAPPAHLRGETIELTIPVRFRLKG